MQLKKGINLGGYLSQCQHSQEHYEAFIKENDIEFIRSKGFDHVRLPIDIEVLADKNGCIKETGINYVSRVINWCKLYGLNVVLDLHKTYGYDFNDAHSLNNGLFNDSRLQDLFINTWSFLAKKYGHLNMIAFELLNEIVELDYADAWNQLLLRAVTEIRRYTNVPIIYGGVQWNSVTTLKMLKKPEFKNIIWTFHFYEPLLFTHQKAYWVKTMNKDLTVHYPASMDFYREESLKLGEQGLPAFNAKAENITEDFIEELIIEGINVAKKNGVELYCGEFGVIDRAPMEDAYRWFETINNVFKKYDIGFSVWSYKAMDFGITDEHYKPIADKLFAMWTK